MNQLGMIKGQFKNMQAAAAGQPYVAPVRLLRKEMVTKPITSQAESRVVLNRIHAAAPTPAKTNEQGKGNADFIDYMGEVAKFGMQQSMGAVFPPFKWLGVTPGWGNAPLAAQTPSGDILKVTDVTKLPTVSPGVPGVPGVPGLPKIGGIGEALEKAGGMMDKILLVAVILSVVGLGSKVLGFIGGNK